MFRRGWTLIELLVVIAVIAILAGFLFPVFAQVREKGRQVHCLSNLQQLSRAFAFYAQDYDELLPYRPTAPEHWGGAGIGKSWPPLAIPPWTAQLEAYIRNRQIFPCPSTRRDWSWPLWAGSWGTIFQGGPWLAHCGYRGYGSAVGRPEWDVFVSYGYNEIISNAFFGYLPLAAFRFPSEFVLAGDSEVAWFTPWGVGETWGISPSGIVRRLAFPEQFPPPNDDDPKAEKATRHQSGSHIVFLDGHGKWQLWGQLRLRSFGGTWRFHPYDEHSN